MTNKKQTAVEWLDEHLDMLLPFVGDKTADAYNRLIKQAKQMEKEQSNDWFEDGYAHGYNSGYNEGQIDNQ